MERLEYLLKTGKKEKLNEISFKKNFADTYNEYIKIFSDNNNLKKKKIKQMENRLLNKGIILIENEQGLFYDGRLWICDDVDYIGKLDYLFTVPSWDWWINPLFNRKKHRNKNKSILIIDKFQENQEEIMRVLASEGFRINNFYNLNVPNYKELFLFYDYLDKLLPMNFARELKRMNDFIAETKPDKLNFILRGGYFLKEFFNSFNGEYNLLNPYKKDLNPNSNEVYIDDCIGSTRTFDSIGFSEKESFNFCCLNGTLPKRVYQKYFPTINFSLPDDLLNIYSCRLFEENLKMIGLNYSKKGLIFYDNPVRDKLISKIKQFQNISDLENKTYKLAKKLIEYEKN